MNALSLLKIVDLNGRPISEKPPIIVETGLDAKQPRGIEYWMVLNQAIQAEPVHERDRMVMDMLAPLGMEKGKEFKPTQNQKSILDDAVIVGEAMTKAIDFNKTGRLPHAEYGPEGNTWEVATASTPNQDAHARERRRSSTGCVGSAVGAARSAAKDPCGKAAYEGRPASSPCRASPRRVGGPRSPSCEDDKSAPCP